MARVPTTRALRYHFSGIAGAGMNPLAQLMRARGHHVQGSDRSFDHGKSLDLAARLRSLGIALHPQDGSAVTAGLDRFVYSTAVEDDTAEVRAARALGIERIARPALLAEIVNAGRPGVAIAGTSGKSTVTAMVAFLAREAGLTLTALGGAGLVGEGASSCFVAGPVEGPVVAEACESDGTLVGYRPSIGLIHNISRDHGEVDEVREQFATFAAGSAQLIVNAACPEAAALGSAHHAETYGDGPASGARLDVSPCSPDRARGVLHLFTGALHHSAGALVLDVPQPGRHNLENAAAAALVAIRLGVKPETIEALLPRFPGVARRFEVIGITSDGIRVVDDYAHNGEKIRAALTTAQAGAPRVVAVFQPHGFGPARFLRPELRELLPRLLRPQDRFCYAEIFYAGGTVDRDLSSRALAEDLPPRLGCAYAADHGAAAQWIRDEARPGDTVLIMGARDPDLPRLARSVFGALAEDSASASALINRQYGPEAKGPRLLRWSYRHRRGAPGLAIHGWLVYEGHLSTRADRAVHLQRGGFDMSKRSQSPSDSTNVNRRQFLKSAIVIAGAGVSPAVLQGRAEAQETPSPIRPESGAKQGGTLRYGVHTAPTHFDVHQSGTVANIGAQSPMYDTLIRRHPKDGQTIIPDLAWKWEITPDGKKYTFYLRKGVKFHDGADLTSEDVKATYDRIAHPPKGVVIPRTPLFSTVSEIVAVDPYRIEFRLSEARPRPFMLGAFASGWNIIVRKKTLEENQGNLRQVMAYPGTGPFKHVSRKDKEVWIMEKNPAYWNKGLPYVDKLEIYHMPPFSAELGASFLSGKLDYARLLDPVSWRKAKEMPGVTAAAFNQSVIQCVFVNLKKKPLNDPRVRRAMHLVMDRNALIEVVKDTAPMQIGGFTYPFHEFSTPRAELEKKLGYQKDTRPAIQEARSSCRRPATPAASKGWTS